MRENKSQNRKRWLAALLALIMICMLVPFTSFAAGASASVSVDKTELKVGDQVTVTVRIKSDGQNLGELSYKLSYTKSVLSIKDASGNDFGGTLSWASAAVGADTYTDTFTFTVVAEGSAEIAFAELPSVQDEDGNAMECSFSAEKTWVQAAGTAASSEAPGSSEAPTSSEAPASSEAPGSSEAPASSAAISCDLSELTVTPGDIAFDPAVTDYTIEVANDVTRVAVTAKTVSEEAGYVVEGYDNFVEGENVVTVHVSASDGSSKDYLIHVMRAAADGSGSDESVGESESESKEVIEGFEWTNEAQTYYITTFPDGVAIPAGYRLVTAEIGNYEVPAYASEKNKGLYLIYAREGEQAFGLHWYREADGRVFPYVDVQESFEFPLQMVLIIAAAVVLVVLIIILVIHLRRNRLAGGSGDAGREKGRLAGRTRSGYRGMVEEDVFPDDDDDDDLDDEADDEFDFDDEDDEDEDSDLYTGGRKMNADNGNADDEDDDMEDFGIDIQLMQAGIEKEVSTYGAGVASPAAKSKTERPRKPAVNSRRVNEATTRIDADRIRRNRENS